MNRIIDKSKSQSSMIRKMIDSQLPGKRMRNQILIYYSITKKNLQVKIKIIPSKLITIQQMIKQKLIN